MFYIPRGRKKSVGNEHGEERDTTLITVESFAKLLEAASKILKCSQNYDGQGSDCPGIREFETTLASASMLLCEAARILSEIVPKVPAENK